MVDTQRDFRTTLASGTAEVIRQRILNLSDGFRPGDRLYPLKLADDLGVSVTPIREALNLLAAEGLVEFAPRRGASVARLSSDELDDLMSVMEGLEMLALRLNGGHWADDELTRLDESLDACERAIAAGDVSEYRTHDDGFHRSLVAGSHSPRLTGLYEMLLKQAKVMEIQNPRYPEAMREALAEHRALVRELSHGDPRRSEKAIVVHWKRARTRMYRKYGEFVGGNGAGARPGPEG
jgi:DNA-binding GntR family transcriptional regulator